METDHAPLGVINSTAKLAPSYISFSWIRVVCHLFPRIGIQPNELRRTSAGNNFFSFAHAGANEYGARYCLQYIAGARTDLSKTSATQTYSQTSSCIHHGTSDGTVRPGGSFSASNLACG